MAALDRQRVQAERVAVEVEFEQTEVAVRVTAEEGARVSVGRIAELEVQLEKTRRRVVDVATEMFPLGLSECAGGLLQCGARFF